MDSRTQVLVRRQQGRAAAPTRWAGLLVGAVVLLLVAVLPARAAAPFVLGTGHIDLFEVTYRADRADLLLQVKDDTEIYAEPGSDPVFRDPSDVEIAVDPALTAIAVPDMEEFRFLGPANDVVYLLDWNGNIPGVPWPGWSTERIPEGVLADESVTLDVAVQGPGDVFTFALDGSGLPFNRYIDTTDDVPEQIPVRTNVHEHTNWVFTELGVYSLDVTAHARTVDGVDVASEAERYTFTVGEATDEPEPTSSPSASSSATSAPDGPPSVSASPTGTSAPSTSPTSSTSRPASPTAQAPNGSAGGGSGNGGSGNGIAGTGGANGPEGNGGASRSVPATTVNRPSMAAASAVCRSTTVTTAPVTSGVTTTGSAVTEGHFDFGARVSGDKLVAQVKDDRTAPPKWRETDDLLFQLGTASEKSLPAGLEFIGPAGTKVHMVGQVQEADVPWLGWNTQDGELVRGAKGPVTMTLEDVQGPGKVAVFLSGSFGGVGQRVFDDVGGPKSFKVPLNTHQHGNWVFTKPGTYRLAVSFAVDLKGSGQQSIRRTLTFQVGPGAVAPAAPSGASSARAQVVGRTPDGRPCTLSDRLASTGASSALLPLLVAGGAMTLAGATSLVLVRRGRRQDG